MTNKRFLRFFVIIVVTCFVMIGISSCGESYGSNTQYLQESTSGSSGSSCLGCTSATSTITAEDGLTVKETWLKNKIELGFTSSTIGSTESTVEATTNANQNINNKLQELAELEETDPDYEIKKQEIKDAYAALNEIYYNNAVALIKGYIRVEAVASSDDIDECNENYKVAIIKEDINNYLTYLADLKDKGELVYGATNTESGYNETQITVEYIETVLNGFEDSFNGSVGCMDVNIQKTANNEISNYQSSKDLYKLLVLFIMQVETRLNEQEPVKFHAESFGDFMIHIFDNLLIFPICWLMYFISKIFGGYYIFGLIITTLLVRTIGWPIYAKSNDMTNKMSALQPELEKIQAKYAGKTDENSQRMMQMEQAKLYRDNKIGIGGCLMPFLQFPIFIAIYRAITRLPYTREIVGSKYTLNWGADLNSTVFGVDLFGDRTAGGVGQLVAILILIVLVVGTQVLTQILSQRRQKKIQEEKQADIPAYRRQAYNQQQNQSQSSMKMMMWMMILMMGVFVWTSKAGLGVYWLIGNVYSMIQTEINLKNSAKKKKLAEQSKGIYTVSSDKKNK